MRLEEIRVGGRVKVAGEHRVPGLRGMFGTIARRYGDADHLALEVSLDDGSSRLFWHHQLDKLEEEGTHRWFRSSSIFRRDE